MMAFENVIWHLFPHLYSGVCVDFTNHLELQLHVDEKINGKEVSTKDTGFFQNLDNSED